MANKRQRKKAAKAAGTYEGQQYRGGRQAGRKNLVKLDTGNLQNQFGVVFTPDEKKALEQAVNTANRKRARMLEAEAKLPRKIAGQDTGDTVASLQLMGKESDFILQRKTKSLQRFRTKEDYDRYMKNLRRVNDRDYITERVRLYKRNHMKAIENIYGDEAKDVIMKIRMMKPAEYMKMVQSDEMLEISYIYDPSARSGKLNQLRASMGMKLKEESEWDEIRLYKSGLPF